MKTQWQYPVAGIFIGGALAVVLNVYGVIPSAQRNVAGVILIVAGSLVGRAISGIRHQG